jgi:hypothetical protein
VTVLPKQLRSPEDGDVALSEEPAKGSDIGPWVDGSVEENQIETMQCQFSEEWLGTALSAGQPNPRRSCERGLQKLRCDELWYRIRDADLETDRAARVPALEGVSQLTSEHEDLVGVAKSDLAAIGQADVPSHPPE